MATNTHINNIIAVRNGGSGLELSAMNDTYIITITSSHNELNGMVLNLNSTHKTNTATTHNARHEMELSDMSNTYMTNITASQQ